MITRTGIQTIFPKSGTQMKNLEQYNWNSSANCGHSFSLCLRFIAYLVATTNITLKIRKYSPPAEVNIVEHNCLLICIITLT